FFIILFLFVFFFFFFFFSHNFFFFSFFCGLAAPPARPAPPRHSSLSDQKPMCNRHRGALYCRAFLASRQQPRRATTLRVSFKLQASRRQLKALQTALACRLALNACGWLEELPNVPVF
ncbi:MAG: hypothetical protein ABWY28_06960, partial [Pseudomonas prosekii]